MDGLLAAWAKGDVKGIAGYGPDNPDMTPEVRKILLENRNRAWIPEIRAMLNQPHTFFITVGAAHLVGPAGVPNLLRDAGYKVDGPDASASDVTSPLPLRSSLSTSQPSSNLRSSH